MTTALLLAAAVGQTFVPNRLDDLTVDRVGEEFARAVARQQGRDPVPPEMRTLFRRMGATDWRERDRASRDALALCRAEPRMARWLWWGRLDTDKEIGLRCNGLIRRLSTCPDCGGAGECGPPTIRWACAQCGGTGSAWPLSMFD